MNSSSTTKVVSSKTANVGTKMWMIGCIIIETAMTVITWSAIPLFFKFWSVICLCIDAFLIMREFILNPINKKKIVFA